jgi:HlyD family secretion protein
MRSFLRRPSLWGTLVVLAAALIFFALRARGSAVRTTPVMRRDLEQHVVATGRVRVPTRVQLSAQVPGLVLAVGVIEGQHVTAGTLLVQIDDREARAAVAQAKAAVDQASARVEQLRRVGAIVATESLRQADANLERALRDFDSASKLAVNGAIAKEQLDNARQAMDVARAAKNAAEAQQASSAPMGADSRIALTALLQTQAQLTGANVRLSQTRIDAPADGTVLSRSVEPGDVVQPARTLLVMAVDGGVELVFQPDERNLGNIEIGQKAEASADAFPQKVFGAEVSYIAPSVDPERGSIEVRLRVAEPPKTLKPDMTVSIDLTVAAKKNALVLPSEAVHGVASASPHVFVVEDGRIAKRAVTLGIHGDGSVEIASGLAPGTEVVVTEGKILKPGQRVRTTAEAR